MKKTKQIKVFGSIGIALLLIVGVVTVGMPLLNQTNTLNQTRADIIASNAKLDTNIAALQLDQANVGKVTALYTELTKKFPSTVEPTALLADVSAAAVKAGMSSANIAGVSMDKPTAVAAASSTSTSGTSNTKTATTAPTTNKSTTSSSSTASSAAGGSLAEMKVTIIVNGSPTQLGAFLGALNEVNRVIKVTGISITSKKEGTSTMTVDGNTYIYKGIAIPAGSTPTVPTTAPTTPTVPSVPTTAPTAPTTPTAAPTASATPSASPTK